MPVATPSHPSPRPSASSKMDKVKVEDRKRSSGASDDGAPPRKKMAINGGVAKDEHDNQAEEVWVEVRLHPLRYHRRRCFFLIPPTVRSVPDPHVETRQRVLLCHLQSDPPLPARQVEPIWPRNIRRFLDLHHLSRSNPCQFALISDLLSPTRREINCGSTC